MNRRLVYVMGPSGAGKDSLLAWLRQRLDGRLPVHWSRRSITRPPRSGGEAHESLDPETFLELRARGGFAMDWQANRHHYGIRREELAPLADHHWVLVNGSRGYLATAQARFPGLTVVHVTASPDTLRQRLLARGRESAAAIEERIRRALAFETPPGVRQVLNDGPLELAGDAFLNHLQAIRGWPA